MLVSAGVALGEDYADQLAFLSRVRIRDQARYRYVLPQMAARCSDLPNSERAADLVVRAHQLVEEAGVPEPIPPLVETLYLLTAEVAPAAKRAQVPLKCSDVAAFYVIARREGSTVADARTGVASLVVGLYAAAAGG